MKKLLRILLRLLLILPAIAFQVLWYVIILVWLDQFTVYLNILSIALQIIFILDILNQRGESKYRLLWITAICLVPIFGIWLYLFSGNKRSSRPIAKRITKRNKVATAKLEGLDIEGLVKGGDITYQTLYMIQNLSHMPVNAVTNAKYYSLGELMYDDMIQDLKNAKSYIFLEYFIIERGKFWDKVVEIMLQKIKENVIVKVLYDDIGSISTHSLSEWESLKKMGIDIATFNPITAIKLTLNNRDHRKMMIIDGKVCYSGGVNIADEYINQKKRFGHWKDIGFRITGNAVQSYTHMFTLFWNAYSKNLINDGDFISYEDESKLSVNYVYNKNTISKTLNNDNIELKNGQNAVFYENSLVDSANLTKFTANSYYKSENNTLENENKGKTENDINDDRGVVISYYDSPNNTEQISNKYFINILSSATKYAYFYTPYLIIGDSLKEAFISAAQRGIDVRIIIPGIPDKKVIYFLTRKYAEELSSYGVKVYVYDSGFVHAKASIVDDRICSIGSVNLDYRSLYLHFENNSIFTSSKLLFDLKEDFLNTQEKSTIIEYKKSKNIFKKLLRVIVDIFAPFL